MIILFEENEVLFTGLGLGVLTDAKSCQVKATLNDSYEVEMLYPYTGKLYDQLKINRIIFCKPDPYNEMEPFRIYGISKPIKGYVTVRAQHLSYDMNGLPVKPISGNGLRDTLDKIQNGSIVKHNFKLYTEKSDSKTFKTTNVYNMRALIMGSEGSLLEKYDLEVYFKKFNVYLTDRVGANRGAQISYAKNLKDITHDINYERLYNGVYPFYHRETTEETTNTSTDNFKQVYIVGTKPYQDGWLSYTPDGEPYHPIDEAPVQVATEGTYYEKVYCWDTNLQRYVEKVYNEMVTLIDSVGGLIGQDNNEETPDWVVIDWSQITSLKLVVKAGEDGYFKMATDSEWTYHKKGEVVFQGSIKDVGNALVLYYSQVIPDSSTSENVESTSVTHVELDDKIIYIDTPLARNMSIDRILTLDLTSEFEDVPDQDALRDKANEYIEKNKIGQYKFDTTVSFVDLTQTTEGIDVKNVSHIELGDTVKVTYNSVGIDVELRVVSTTYDAVSNKYTSINLGEKPDKLSADSVQTGDNVSSLTNDVGYTDITTVNKLVAKIVTADFLKARNAELTKAQIEQLETARIKVTGLIEATQFELDQLVAKLLIADNAVVKETLEAGNIKVKGDISVTSGEITIESKKEDGTIITFKVDRSGNVTANSVKITGGDLNINNNFIVTNDGILTAVGAEISGKITATSGNIAGFEINKGYLEYNNSGNYVRLGTDLISLGAENPLTNHRPFEVDNQGNIYAISGNVAGFEIQNGKLEYSNSTSGTYVHVGTDKISLGEMDSESNHRPFEVDNQGNLYSVAGTIGGFTIGATSISNGVTSIDDTSHNGVYIGTDGIRLGPNFKIDKQGNVTATGIRWEVSRTITYNSDSQGTNPPVDGWTSNIPTVNPGNYLWSRTKILYIDNTFDYIYAVSRQPTNGGDGNTPYIGNNGHWYIGNTDTGVVAEGQDGSDGATPTIGNDGYWYINGVSTGVKAEGEDGKSIAVKPDAASCTVIGEDGYIDQDPNSQTYGHLLILASYDPVSGVKTWTDAGEVKGPKGDNGRDGQDGRDGTDGSTPYIGANGNWWINGTDTQVKAEGVDGQDGSDGDTPTIGNNGNWWIGGIDTGVKAEGQDGQDGSDGNTPYIQDGYWYINGASTGVKAEGEDGQDGRDGTDGTNGQDGLTPFIGANGNWWIGETDTGVKAEGHDGSDANVTWANVTAVFDTSAQTTKGIYYAQDHDGNLALLLNATAGQIGSFQIYADMLQAGTSGNRVVVSPGVQKALFNVTKYWSFLAGVEYTESGGVETYTNAKFGVSKDGEVYAKSLHLTGGDISFEDPNGQSGYELPNGASDFHIEYEIYWDEGSFEQLYTGASAGKTITPYNFRRMQLPVTINGIPAGTLVPVFSTDYDDGDFYNEDIYWWCGTYTYNNIIYDLWIKDETYDGNYGEGLTSSTQNRLLATRAVQNGKGGFFLSADGHLIATSVDLTGKITATSGSIAGFNIESNHIVKSGILSEYVYIGTDFIRLGKPSTPSFSINKGTMYSGTTYKFDLTTATFPIPNTVFKLAYDSGLTNKTISITESDDDSTYTSVFVPGTLSNVWTLPAQSNHILIDAITKKYVKITPNNNVINSVLSVDALYSFAVSNKGFLSATSVDLSGKITATSGNIAGFSINQSSLSYGTKQTANSVYIGTDGIYLGTAFSITRNGVLSATSGSIGPLSITSTELKFSYNGEDYIVINSDPGVPDYRGNYNPGIQTKYLAVEELYLPVFERYNSERQEYWYYQISLDKWGLNVRYGPYYAQGFISVSYDPVAISNFAVFTEKSASAIRNSANAIISFGFKQVNISSDQWYDISASDFGLSKITGVWATKKLTYKPGLSGYNTYEEYPYVYWYNQYKISIGNDRESADFFILAVGEK